MLLQRRLTTVNQFNSLLNTCHKRSKTYQGFLTEAEKKKFPTNRALQHFDDFYKNVYGKKWPSIRLALLSPQKYIAVINNFGDPDETCDTLKNEGALDLKTLIELTEVRQKETSKELKRQEFIDKVYTMDQVAEQTSKASQINYHSQHKIIDNPCDILDSDNGKQDTENDTANNITKDLSLHSKLEAREIDESRLIDPNIGASSGALYEFIPATELKGMDDWIPESQHYSYYKQETEFPVSTKVEEHLHFPETLKIYTFDRGNIFSFPEPRRTSTGTSSYYLLNGSSLLPVLALGIEPYDTVLDMCAAPGGKSLMIWQTLYPALLTCNDIQESRIKQIKSVLRRYLYDVDENKSINITQSDGIYISDKDTYNKILVDVPCTTDRHCLHENDNNIFKPARTKERLKLPEQQTELLCNALKLVKVGGTVVYSTCSLSPIQNDGVVHMALKKIWEETNFQIEVRNLNNVLEPTKCIFHFAENTGLRYGSLVLPFLPNNFGPLYFCKLVKIR